MKVDAVARIIAVCIGTKENLGNQFFFKLFCLYIDTLLFTRFSVIFRVGCFTCSAVVV